MRSQEPVRERAVPDCDVSTGQPTVTAGPEVVWARTPHLPLKPVAPKATWAAPNRNASCNAGARTVASLPPESPAGQRVPPLVVSDRLHPHRLTGVGGAQARLR